MSYIYVKLKKKWRVKFAKYIIVTDCKKVVNSKTNTIIKYNLRGYFICGKYYKKSELNKILELIPKKEYCPF